VRRGRCEIDSDGNGREGLASLAFAEGELGPVHFASLGRSPWTPSSSWTPSTPSRSDGWVSGRTAISIWQRESDAVVPGRSIPTSPTGENSDMRQSSEGAAQNGTSRTIGPPGRLGAAGRGGGGAGRGGGAARGGGCGGGGAGSRLLFTTALSSEGG